MDKDKSNITIADVARKAGFSKTTVSRYLNGKFEFMSGESKRRIQETIEELNFRPNNLARSLKSSKSRLIGVLVADISSPFSSIIVQGITDCCNQYGYHAVVANTNNDYKKEREYVLSMIDQRVEALIVNTTGRNDEFLRTIEENHVPIVLVDRPTFPTMFDTVRTSDFQATVEAIQYLVEVGFTSVALFTEPVEHIGTRVIRQRAYREACANLKLRQQEYIIDSTNRQRTEELLRKLLAENKNCTNAIFTANGVTMLNVLEGIQNLGLRIPEDVGVCGYDDWPWVALIGPGITAVSQPSYDVGVECVNRVMFRLQGNRTVTPEIIELPSKLVIRGSTKLHK